MAARLFLALALVTSIWPFVGGGAAHACICAKRELSSFVENSDVIVIGKVVSVRTTRQTFQYYLDNPDLIGLREVAVYHVVAQQYLSGGGGKHLSVQDINGPCASPIEETGGEYLFYLQLEKSGSLMRSQCSGSFEIRDYTPQSSIDVVEREAALQGKDVTVSSFTDDPLPPWATAAGLGAALAVGASLLFGVRRLRSG